MPHDDKHMRHVIQVWLAARASFHEGNKESVEAYCDADDQLLAAFARYWPAPDDPHMFDVSYREFRRRLVASSSASNADCPCSQA
jgi:hypothetical protein